MDPLTIAAVGWGLTATGWLVSPYITRLLDSAYAHLKPGKSRDKIRSLVNETVPRLKLLLEAAEDSEHKDLFEQLLKDLKSAFYDTEDVLNEVEYIRRHGSVKRKWNAWFSNIHIPKKIRFPKIRFSKKNSVPEVILPGKTTKDDSTKGKLDSIMGQGSSNQVIGTLSSLTITGHLRKRLKGTMTKIGKLIKSAHKTLKLLKLPNESGSDKNIQNVPAESISGPINSEPEGEVIGRKYAIDEIKEMLRQTEDIKRLSVIGIIGIRGSGKTTLARCVCQSERRDSHFDLVMWIQVNENFDINIIYRDMFEQAWMEFGGTKKCPKHSSFEVLKEKLKKVLNGKLVLLILDNIWFGHEKDTTSLFQKDATSDKKLADILIPLVGVQRKSKILLTSRQDSLLRLGPTVKSTAYKIPDMDDANFLKLFMYYALDYSRVKDDVTAEKLENIGAEIAVKLKKSVLLARVVGSALFQKQEISVTDWQMALDDLDKKRGGLLWSYTNLSEQARRCFAYCSIFPRRYLLRKDKLVNLWVAEGFINSKDTGKEMEIDGHRCFEELRSSSFLLPGGKDHDGKKYFFIHDVLYDLAVKLAGDDCFKIENSWSSEVPLNVRHLSIQSCTASMVTEHIVKLKKLRTLIIYNFDKDFFFKKDEYFDEFEDGKGFDKMFRQLSELRVLIFGTDTDSHRYLHFSFPKSIGFLKYLRYLGVHRRLGIHAVTLPDTVEKLYLLQVLELGRVRALYVHSSFGEDLIKLADLRHVYSKFGKCFGNMGRLSSLQTMPALHLADGEGHELYQLQNLNKLEGELIISGLACVESKEEALNANLAQKKLLTKLILSWSVKERKDCSRELQAEVLEALRPPGNIMYLTIEGYDGSRYPTWMVGKKESTISLSKLVLILCRQPVCDPGLVFSRVISLELHYCKWGTFPDNMKDIKSLVLGNCSMPSSLGNLTSLERLGIYSCSGFRVPILPSSLGIIEIFGCASNETEDQILEKIKHIPHFVLLGNKFKGTDPEGTGRRFINIKKKQEPKLGESPGLEGEDGVSQVLRRFMPRPEVSTSF